MRKIKSCQKLFINFLFLIANSGITYMLIQNYKIMLVAYLYFPTEKLQIKCYSMKVSYHMELFNNDDSMIG